MEEERFNFLHDFRGYLSKVNWLQGRKNILEWYSKVAKFMVARKQGRGIVPERKGPDIHHMSMPPGSTQTLPEMCSTNYLGSPS